MTEQTSPVSETLIENLLQACVDYERCERFDAKHRRLDLEEAKQAIRNAISADHAPCQQVRVTDEMVERALKEESFLIQGYSYADRHSIRDFRQDKNGPEIWSCPFPNPEAFHERLAYERLKAQLIAALSDTSTVCESKP